MRVAVLLLVAVVACSPSLTVPADKQVECERDEDCLGDSVCAIDAGYCVSLAASTPGAPVLLSPVAGSVVLGVENRTYAFAWTAIAEARNYVVQVATDADFSVVVAERKVAATVAEIELERAVTYWWRVRADTAGAGFADGHPQSQFDLLSRDFIAVGCETLPPPETDPSWTARVGNLAKPFCDINSGVSAARVYGISEVRVAGIAAPYVGTVTLAEGVSLRGGFATDFVSAPDPMARPTTIKAFTDVNALIASDITERKTVVEGFELTHDASDITPSEVVVVRISGCNDALEVRNNRIQDVNATSIPDGQYSTIDSAFGTFSATMMSVGVGVFNNDAYARGPVIADNQIVGGNVVNLTSDVRAAGILLRNAKATIERNVISSGHVGSIEGTCDTDGIVIEEYETPFPETSLFITHNVIAAGQVGRQRGGAAACGTKGNASDTSAIRATEASGVRVVGNVLTAGPAWSVAGVRLAGTAFGWEIVSNTVSVRASASSEALGVSVGLEGRVVDNILVLQGDAQHEYSVYPLGVPMQLESNATTGFLFAYGPSDASFTAAESQIRGSGGSAMNNFVSAIEFCDAADADYRLSPLTPIGVRAQGSVHGDVTTDLRGAARTCPTAGTDCWSIGAYESDADAPCN